MGSDVASGVRAGNFLEKGRLFPPPVVGMGGPPRRPYAPRLRMWPPASMPLVTTVTVSCPKSSTLLQVRLVRFLPRGSMPSTASSICSSLDHCTGLHPAECAVDYSHALA